MTGGFRSFWIMRPHYCWTPLHVSILAVLFLTLNADSEDSECSSEINVRRHTKYEAFLGKELRIKCPITFCNISPPKVFWVKSAGAGAGFLNVSNDAHIRVEWETLRQYEGTSYLIFQSILENDAGVYRCEISDTVGHIINVSISGQGESSNSSLNETRVKAKDPDSAPTFTEDVWIYVYSAAGISSFVIIVIIISIISMKGCKGKSKKEARTENQYMSIPMAEQRATLQPSPRGSPCVPPSQRSTKRKAPSRQPNELPSSRVNVQLYGQTEEDRNRQRHTVSVEESQSVVYAALNHNMPQRAAARQLRQEEETSEYAAIRVA
ncbi:B- and T-lymphocyte attenuator-like [Odontesthes bonariensis]|uniref:B- and T-lymphocyte attenuator-like n=1 Tax=Odontesthes bonariensis TaxID=219752 RepID=UPI003F58A59C